MQSSITSLSLARNYLLFRKAQRERSSQSTPDTVNFAKYMGSL